MGKKLSAENFIKAFDNILIDKNEQQREEMLSKFTKKVIAKRDTKLSLKYAYYFKDYLSQQEIDSLGQEFLERKDNVGCVKFCISFKPTNFKDYQKFIAESGNQVYILYFLKNVEGVNLEYFSKKIANKLSPIQNIDFVCDFDLENIIPHSKAIAKKGSLLDNYEYLLTIYDFYEADATSVYPNIKRIVESKDVEMNLEIAKIFPSEYLPEQAKIIAESNDIEKIILAYNCWPNYEGNGEDLALFEKLIKSKSKSDIKAVLMFNLKIKDLEYIDNILEYFFPEKEKE